MSLSPAGYPADLDPSNPKGTDPGSILDDQDRNILLSIQQSFPNLNSAVTATPAQLNWTGYGGLKADAPKSITLTITTSVALTVTGYDSVSYATPIDVTQTLAGGILVLEAGSWYVSASAALRAVSTTHANRGIDGRVRISSGASTPVRATASIQADQTFFSLAASGVIELASSTSLEVALTALGADVDVDFLDGLNFQAQRIAL